MNPDFIMLEIKELTKESFTVCGVLSVYQQ